MNLSEYLAKKIEQLGIDFFYGGIDEDKSKTILAIKKNTDLKYVSCNSEKNAFYAAMGYANIKGFGTVYLNSQNAAFDIIATIKECYDNNIPIILIVEVSDIKSLNAKADNDLYLSIFNEVLNTVVCLNRDNAKIEIDRMIKNIVNDKKPIYLAIPENVFDMEIPYRELDFDNSLLLCNKKDFSDDGVFIEDPVHKNIAENCYGNEINLISLCNKLRKFISKNDILLIDSNFNNNIIDIFADSDKTNFYYSNLKSWGIPAVLGSYCADFRNKTMLITDVEAFEQSAFEIKNILSNGYKPVILLLNQKNKDNDIQIDYMRFIRIFSGETWATKVDNVNDIEKALRVTQIINKLCIIEIIINEENLIYNNNDLSEDTAKNIILKNDAENITELTTDTIKLTNEEIVLNKNISYATHIHTSLKELE
ncbi:hypothetical protein IJO12_06180 [bacterium]|nr:hypothetical protein [bacterium]